MELTKYHHYNNCILVLVSMDVKFTGVYVGGINLIQMMAQSIKRHKNVKKKYFYEVRFVIITVEGLIWMSHFKVLTQKYSNL